MLIVKNAYRAWQQIILFYPVLSKMTTEAFFTMLVDVLQSRL